ncbi:L domain-like protein [Calocera cornea HHB12733]|uniref:L domain-like protein n=1 Tax=Calocera cornea HHB12733 TaxID=1353952 RepID=A0A165I9B4_9BASI|nr:L domain-like protein [Calocera cornea HHB12733]
MVDNLELGLEENKEQDAGDSSDGNPFSETPSRPPLSRTSSGITTSSDPSTEDEAPLPAFALKRKSSRSFAAGNATFLTECSFGVAHDALVKYITDAEPYVVHWERLKRVELSGKAIDSVARLKEFLPVVEQVDLNDNRIAWLTGLPPTLLHLSIASNLLTGLTAYKHLPKLQYLNISHNQVDSFQQLAALTNLRELHADYNCLTSLDGLRDIPLRVLTVRGNKIQKVDVRMTQWYDLELLDLSQNQISDLQGVEHLESLVTLNLDGNRLDYFSILGSRLPALHVLRLSDNRLSTLNIAGLDVLRTLYADDNRLSEVIGLEDCRTLHNLSLRNQSQKLRFSARDVRDVKRLYLSGNPLSQQFFSCALPSISYAELSSCQLATLPPLRQVMPNVVTLALNWNHFPNLDFLQGLRQLQRVVAVGCRVESLEMDTVLGGLEQLRELDLRMNSFTLGWYLPVMSDLEHKEKRQAVEERDSNGDVAARSSANPTPEDLDKKYRRGLPDALYVPRAMWRGLVMERCPAITRLDGLEINEKERIKTRKLLEQLRLSGLVLDRAEE